MILCEREIQALARRKLITIDPCPGETSRQWSSTALDLTLHDVVVEWIIPNLPTGASSNELSPMSDQFDVTRMIEDLALAKRVTVPREGYALKPHGFVLGYTVEKVGIPHDSRIAARVEGKSSMARIGLGVHVTAPTIHAGFGASTGNKGLPIQLEIFNLGPWTIRLQPGMRICQLIFEEVREVPNRGYAGQFGDQRQFTV
ncbi:MAG: hypothetical protein LC104_06735 [Bacteroidales bacterium]|nr:hypothetical protein [Bacteroidales bacterium]